MKLTLTTMGATVTHYPPTVDRVETIIEHFQGSQFLTLKVAKGNVKMTDRIDLDKLIREWVVAIENEWPLDIEQAEQGGKLAVERYAPLLEKLGEIDASNE
jgi:hypothetical protein